MLANLGFVLLLVGGLLIIGVISEVPDTIIVIGLLVLFAGLFLGRVKS